MLSRRMEKRALCPRHQRWEAVESWRWTDVPPDMFDSRRFEWVKQMVATTVTGCLVAYTIDPVNGVKLRPDLLY